MSKKFLFPVFLCGLLLWAAAAYAADGTRHTPRPPGDLHDKPGQAADENYGGVEPPEGELFGTPADDASGTFKWTPGGVFGQPERPATADDPWHRKIQPLWQRVLKVEKESPAFTANAKNFGPVDAFTWRNLVVLGRKSPELEKLRLINGYFNQWRPKNDADAWGSPEYWTSPREFIQVRGGDCEDYAIAKYFALRFLGVSADRMRIIIVRRKEENGVYAKDLHAVLVVRANDIWFILDNNARPRNNIFPHTQYRGRFDPIYSVNEHGAWIHGNQAGTTTPVKQ